MGAFHGLTTTDDPILAASCATKTRYKSEQAARVTARTQVQNRPELERLYVYGCGHCRGWHLTRREQKRSLPVTARHLREGFE